MAITKVNTHVEWSAADFKDILASGEEESDAVAIDDTAVRGSLSVYVDNQGTKAAGDELLIKVLYTNGDTDNDPEVADIYDTHENVIVAHSIDTNAHSAGTPQATIPIDTSRKGFKLYGNNLAGTNTLRVWAKYREQRSA